MDGLGFSSLWFYLLIKGGGSRRVCEFLRLGRQRPGSNLSEAQVETKGPHKTDFLSRQKIPAEVNPWIQDYVDLRVPTAGGPDLCQVSVRILSPNSRIAQHKNFVNDDYILNVQVHKGTWLKAQFTNYVNCGIFLPVWVWAF